MLQILLFLIMITFDGGGPGDEIVIDAPPPEPLCVYADGTIRHCNFGGSPSKGKRHRSDER